MINFLTFLFFSNQYRAPEQRVASAARHDRRDDRVEVNITRGSFSYRDIAVLGTDKKFQCLYRENILVFGPVHVLSSYFSLCFVAELSNNTGVIEHTDKILFKLITKNFVLHFKFNIIFVFYILLLIFVCILCITTIWICRGRYINKIGVMFTLYKKDPILYIYTGENQIVVMQSMHTKITSNIYRERNSSKARVLVQTPVCYHDTNIGTFYQFRGLQYLYTKKIPV